MERAVAGRPPGKSANPVPVYRNSGAVSGVGHDMVLGKISKMCASQKHSNATRTSSSSSILSSKVFSKKKKNVAKHFGSSATGAL